MHYNFRMAEVRKYFFCTDNLTACKIIGGIQITSNTILLIISVVALTELTPRGVSEPVGQRENALDFVISIAQWFTYSNRGGNDAPTRPYFLESLVAVWYGLGILLAIFLVVAASKRNVPMIVAWMFLNLIGIGWSFYTLFEPRAGLASEETPKARIEIFISIGLGIWAELIAIGARQEVKGGPLVITCLESMSLWS